MLFIKVKFKPLDEGFFDGKEVIFMNASERIGQMPDGITKTVLQTREDMRPASLGEILARHQDRVGDSETVAGGEVKELFRAFVGGARDEMQTDRSGRIQLPGLTGLELDLNDFSLRKGICPNPRPVPDRSWFTAKNAVGQAIETALVKGRDARARRA